MACYDDELYAAFRDEPQAVWRQWLHEAAYLTQGLSVSSVVISMHAQQSLRGCEITVPLSYAYMAPCHLWLKGPLSHVCALSQKREKHGT